ncbi:alpha/beta fold hydrolase [Paenibacillus sp. NEAU-GSW1]|uniref:alpha/beta fold hydrolase n=1 Tax=Paenibacillus sp. NEAU-GSW1 TaxID=2682486 RepID=UPI0012E2B72E|nr:alpha/beta fold hydrolase [Paenibacillus sp. NEAU-GSW1]MUT65951.1 alpha/beta fold hydrolase [Paenibacillus sp. NEAU-GSW1]
MNKSKAPIFKDKNGIRLRNSVANISPISIRGNKQWILVRGRNIQKPLLLFLHGGPGVTTMGFASKLQRQLEEHFICVHWDQRGAGKSYDKRVFNDHLTIDDYVEDIRVLSIYLSQKYNKQKIILVGRSWGTIIGSLAAHRYPELFHAYIGIGQVVHMMEGERMLIYGVDLTGGKSRIYCWRKVGSSGFSGDERRVWRTLGPTHAESIYRNRLLTPC